MAARSVNDLVEEYARLRRWQLAKRTVIVEGTTDEGLYGIARRWTREACGVDVYADGLSFVAAGKGDRGGASGVIRELTTLRSLSEHRLDAGGRPVYRFVGLLDNDAAGRRAVKNARSYDPGIQEYRDILRIRPVMPVTGNLDPKTLERNFDKLNTQYERLDWELEDLLPRGLLEAFSNTHPAAIRDKVEMAGRVHWKLTAEGKGKLHRYVKAKATYADLAGATDVIRSIRFVLNLPRR